MTTSQHILGLFFVTLLASACAGQETSPQAESTDTRAELARTESALYAISRTDDGVLYAARAGVEATRCGDGVTREACAVGQLDLSRVDMTPDDEVLARAHIADGSALVRAKLIAAPSGDDALVVTQVWARDRAVATHEGQRASADQLYVLRDVHEACTHACAPCEWVRAEPVAGGEATHFADLVLEAVGGELTDAERAQLAHGELLAQGAGLGAGFVVASLFSPFPAPVRAPEPAIPGPRPPLR